MLLIPELRSKKELRQQLVGHKEKTMNLEEERDSIMKEEPDAFMSVYHNLGFF